MVYEFIQVSANKPNGDFSICSNLTLMDSLGMSPKSAEIRLASMAEKLAAEGFTVTWHRYPLTEQEVGWWGDLFQVGQWEEDQRIFTEFG